MKNIDTDLGNVRSVSEIVSSRTPHSTRSTIPLLDLESQQYTPLRIKTPSANPGRPTEKIDLNLPKLSSRKTPRTYRAEIMLTLHSTGNLNSAPMMVNRGSNIPRSLTSMASLENDSDEHVLGRVDNSLSELTKYENYKFQRWNRTLETNTPTPVEISESPSPCVTSEDGDFMSFMTEVRSKSRLGKRPGTKQANIEEDSAENLIKQKQSRNRYFTGNRTSSLYESKSQRPSTAFDLYKQQVLESDEKSDELDTNWKQFGMTSTSNFMQKIMAIEVKKSTLREVEDELQKKIKSLKENSNKKSVQNHLKSIKLEKLKKREELLKTYKKDIISENKSVAGSMTKEIMLEKRLQTFKEREEKIRNAKLQVLQNIIDKEERIMNMVREKEQVCTC